ncbi:MAG: hypothetical protein ACMUIP_01250 [bacterium]
MSDFLKRFLVCFFICSIIGIVTGLKVSVCNAQFPFYISSFPQTSSVSIAQPFSSFNNSYYFPNSNTLAQTFPTLSYYSPTAIPTTTYTSNSFYQPSTSANASITGSYASFTNITPTATTSGYYLPSITTNPVLSSAATSFYSPTFSTTPVVAAPVAAPVVNPYVPNATYYPNAGIFIDIDGAYVGEWESTMRIGEEGDIKKCEIDQDGIILDGGLKFKDFLIAAKEPEFTGEINGSTVSLDVLMGDDVIVKLLGEAAIDQYGDITIVGTFTAIALYNGALLDQGIFELEEE